MKTIGGLFGRSAFGPLHEQALKVNTCVAKVPEMIEAWVAADWPRVLDICGQLHQLESQADDIKDEIRVSLSHSIFGSVERGEILQAVQSLDGVADSCEEAGKLLEMRKTPCPPATRELFPRLARQLTQISSTLTEITANMRELLASSFDRRVAKKILDLVERASYEEYQADQLEQDVLKKLFENESESDPVSVLMVVQIAREMGTIGDKAENAADVLSRFTAQR